VLSTAGGARITIADGNIICECPGTISVKASVKQFLAGEAQWVPMPTLPHVPLPPGTPFKFDLRMGDVAGPMGAAQQGVPWRIVAAASPAAARLTKKTLLQGLSSAQGKATLSADQESTLREAYDHHPGGLWLLTRSKVRQVTLQHERDDWTDEQRAAQALDAMSYRQGSEGSGQAGENRHTRSSSRKEHKASAGAALLAKIKG
jgi:hypothetical protein